MEGKVVLVEGGIGHQSARVTLITARTLARARIRPTVLTWNPLSLAGSSRSVASVVVVPDAPAAARAVAGLEPSTLLPTSDAASLGLSLPGSDVIDKRALHALAGERGVPIPETQVFADAGSLRGAASTLPYPVVVKPVIGKPVAIVRSAADVDRFLRVVRPGTAVVVQPVLAGPVLAVAGVAFSGSLEAVVHQVAMRAWPSASGTTTAARTTEPDPALESWARALVEGRTGIFHAQFLDRRLLDLNLRPYGSLALAEAAGVNLPAIAVAGAAGRSEPLRARPGMTYRWIEGDLRLAMRRIGRDPARAIAIAREHRPRLGTAHGDAGSLRDLGPSLARLRSRGPDRWTRT